MFTELAKLRVTDLALVVRVCVVLDGLDELGPLGAELVENLSVDLDGLVLVHFLVEHAEVLVALGGLPALVVLAHVRFALLGLVLSEV